MKMNRIKNRRGITLLFVISMIVLFLLMGTAFVLVSNDFVKASRIRNRVRVKINDSRQLIERAMLDLVRGVNLDNTDSPLKGQSILGDMYGYGMRAVVRVAQTNPSQQFIRLELAASVPEYTSAIAAGKPVPFAQMILDDRILETVIDPDNFPFHLNGTPGRFDGQILTFVSGKAQGMSARIIEHQVTGNSVDGFVHSLIVLPVSSDATLTPFTLADQINAPTGQIRALEFVNNLGMRVPRSSNPDAVIINNRAFSGTGAGSFDPRTNWRRPALSDGALRPNSGPVSAAPNGELDGLTRQEFIEQYSSRLNYTDPLNPVLESNYQSICESYDTFDFQNMFLGGIRIEGGNPIVIPSFHRPKLLTAGGGMGGRSDFRAFPNQNNPQVDNTGDGMNDGHWIDINLPIRYDDNGRRYKPLVSYFVMDAGGKTNVNAHGNLSQLTANNRFVDTPFAISTPVRSLGSGYGPHEITMSPLFSEAEAAAMMVGDGSATGRYGINAVAGTAASDPIPNPDRDIWSAYKLYGYPVGNFGANPSGVLGNAFQSSPMDIFGRFAYGYPDIVANPGFQDIDNPLFNVGMPVANVAISELANEIANSPLEMNFSPGPFARAGDDTPFSIAELERVYRQNDRDAFMLPNRLQSLANSLSGNARFMVTTDSYEVPTTFDNLATKLYSILNTPNPTGASNVGVPLAEGDERDEVIRANIVNSAITISSDTFRREMVAPELRRGLPMDVNRPFGDFVDGNDGDLVVDNFGETGSIAHPDANGNLTQTALFDSDNDGVISGDADEVLSRQVFARQLYMTILLNTQWVDRNGDGAVNLGDWYDFNGDGATDTVDLVDYRRVVAQWCINVVDFRDPDSIMSPFEVDLQPWDGWDVDGDLTTPEATIGADRAVFWGCERPEMLITETFATHDLREEDTDADLNGNTQVDGDPTFDSHLLPVSAAFFELYNPWVQTGASQIFPTELYDNNANPSGVDLQKMALEDGASPIWRMTATVNTDPSTRGFDPDDNANNAGDASATTWRRIYFIRPQVTALLDQFSYYPPNAVSVPPVRPGDYAVAGSATAVQGNSYHTWFGRRQDGDLDETRRITLDTNTNGGQVVTRQWDDTLMDMVDVTRDAIVIPINQNFDGSSDVTRSLGLSDPLGGYAGFAQTVTPPAMLEPSIAPTSGLADGQRIVDAATMAPVFADNPAGQWADQNGAPTGTFWNTFLRQKGLHSGLFTIHLQRLANPLLAYDPVSNPYRTVDSNAVDLHSFNGVESTADTVDTDMAIKRFGSFERRSGTQVVAGTQPSQNTVNSRYRMLFKTNLQGKNPTAAEANVASPILTNDLQHVFNRNFAHSLGRLNDEYVTPTDGGVATAPFAWLTWNNRPYVSALELANVPYTSSFALSSQFDVAHDDTVNPYQTPMMNSPELLLTGANPYSGVFPHLLAFEASTGPTGARPSAAWLHRIFDYVQVPSRFSGTETYLDALDFEDAANNFGLYDGYAAPFDSISHYRYPGKININTVTDDRVWRALMGPIYGTTGVTFANWQMSRQGSSPLSDYANPYRASNAHNWVPNQDMVAQPAGCGLFRRSPVGGAAARPLFELRDANVNDVTKRCAYFRNDMRQRLGNLVTMRSSVFSIWITIGFFEVDDDGSLGDEIGEDFGEEQRHRAFFVLDRSIPVAFEPGKNHNIEKAIRVSSFIE